MSTPETLPRRPSRPAPPPLLLGSALLHAGAVAALAAAPAAWPWICGTVFADHVAVAMAGLTPRSRLLGPNLTRLPPEEAGNRAVALTFDDGPDPDITPLVLDRLDEHGARATFFCIGERVASHPDLTAEIARRGHRVENHSFTHPNLFTLYVNPALRREIARAQETIESATGRRPRLFRAPAGLRSFLLEGELRAAGLGLTSWTRRAFDTVDADPQRVAARLGRGLAAGDILVLHDGRGARTANGRPVVLEALPRLLDAMTGRGLEAVPIRTV